MLGGFPDDSEDFQFDLPAGDQRQPDETIVIDAMKAEVKEKLGGGETREA